jgi:TusA-related sulfurtransferase
MVAIKGHFDGKKVTLPKDMKGVPPGEVIVIFTELGPAEREKQAWMKAQELALAKVWDNPEDAIYDSL